MNIFLAFYLSVWIVLSAAYLAHLFAEDGLVSLAVVLLRIVAIPLLMLLWPLSVVLWVLDMDS